MNSRILLICGKHNFIEHQENEIYLVIYLGIKFLFNITFDLPQKLDMVADSALAPWQTIEVLEAILEHLYRMVLVHV